LKEIWEFVMTAEPFFCDGIEKVVKQNDILEQQLREQTDLYE
jgi:hypothetical protein